MNHCPISVLTSGVAQSASNIGIGATLVPATAILRRLRHNFGSLVFFRKGRRYSSMASPIKTPLTITALSQAGILRIITRIGGNLRNLWIKDDSSAR